MPKNTKEIVVYKDYCNNMVRQSNEFTMSVNQWSLNAKKVSRIFGSIFNRYPDKDYFYFKSADIGKFIGYKQVKGGSVYSEIPKITKEIMSNVLAVPLGKKKFRQLPMLAMVDHDLGYGIIGIKVHPEAKDFFIELTDTYTEYKLSDVMPLKSEYSFDMFELIKLNKHLKEFTISIEELKVKLNAHKEASYKKYNNFKRKAIEVACNEISLKTNIQLTYEPIKRGKSYEFIKFMWEVNENFECELTEDVIDNFAETHEIIEAFKTSTNGADISAATLTELMEIQSFEVVKYYAEHINEYISKSVSNIQGFFIDAVKKHGTEKQYARVFKITQLEKPTQRNNFEQREYDDEYFDNFFTNK
jgi:plasmid replication initiation protein